jgi:hypothetical protein
MNQQDSNSTIRPEQMKRRTILVRPPSPRRPFHYDRNPFRKGNEIIAALLICCVQFMLMISLTIFFLSSRYGAEEFFLALPFLGDYIPIVRRLSPIFAKQGNFAEYYRAYAIYCSYVMLQIVVFSSLVFLFLRGANFRDSRPTNSKHGWGFLVVLIVTGAPVLFMFFGDFDLADPGFFSNRVIYGHYFSGYYLFCVLIPLANWSIYFFSFLRY